MIADRALIRRQLLRPKVHEAALHFPKPPSNPAFSPLAAALAASNSSSGGKGSKSQQAGGSGVANAKQTSGKQQQSRAG